MKKYLFFIVLVILGFGFLIPSYSRALTIGPPIFEFSADPGDVITDVIRLSNEQDKTKTYYSSFETFVKRSSSSGTQFTGKREDLALWIETNPSSITLAPGQGISVPFTIKIPETADPGGHYAAIFWGSAPAQGTGSGVGIISRLAVLVFLNVSGEAIEQAEVSNFRAAKNLFTHLPINFSFLFRNTGTIHFKPKGEIIIKNLFGKTKAILPVSVEGYIVLPKNEMSISTIWQSSIWEPGLEIEEKGFFFALNKELADLHFGYHKANLNLEFGDKGSAKESFGFWLIPWRVLLLGGIGLAIFLFIVVLMIKRYNKWIIAKAREQISPREIKR